MPRLAWIIVTCYVLSAYGCVKQGNVGKRASDSLAMAAQTQFLVETPKGEFVIALFDDTPQHKRNFIRLVEIGYYDDLVFHRVVPELIIQAGDPQFRTSPNPALDSLDRTTIPAEIKHSHFRGTVAAARKDDQENPQRASSATQFYINLNDNRFYDGSYTVFGRVVEGMETVDKIAKVARDGRNIPYERIWLKIRPLGEK